jgi:imidazolonepropionase-like amidohydrolase
MAFKFRGLPVPVLLLLSCARPEPETTAFVGVTLLTLSGEPRTETVLVRDGKISGVGKKVPPEARVIEGQGRFLMPGLVDMHAHLVREEDLLVYLARGVTTVRNMWGAPVHLEWRKRIEKGELLGPTLYTAGPIVDGEDPVHEGSLIVRTPEDADRAVAHHKQMGYDFMKIYSGLSAPAAERLLAAAKSANLLVAGHVPRGMGLGRAVDAGLGSIEHLTGVVDALQADDSPVRDKQDRASRQKKIDHVDEKKLPQLVQKLQGTASCPTRTVMISWGPAAESEARLQRPEMRYVPACDRATWRPRPDDATDLDRSKRTVALYDKLLRALHQAGGTILVGTDTVNPLVVPGFSLHEELQLLHNAGIGRRDVLRAATRGAAEWLRASDQFGAIAVGQRADLLLLDANPLTDIANTQKIAGVMVRGRWLEKKDLEALLAKVAAQVDGRESAFRGLPELKGARYDVTWNGAYFGSERIAVDDERIIRAQSFDAHKGQRMSLTLWPDGSRLLVESDGASGRGRAEVEVSGESARITGKLLSGGDFSVEEKLAGPAFITADQFLAGHLVLVPRLMPMEVGAALHVPQRLLQLGSTVSLREHPLRITRGRDERMISRGKELTARRYELHPVKGPPSVLMIDENGWPLELAIPVYGSTVKLTRVE